MELTNKDKICIPPPLFHCFGLVLGNLAAFTHGAAAVYASESFNTAEVLRVVSEEKCTGLHGVPTMFVTELDNENFGKYDYSSLRTGIAAGASVPAELMERIHKRLNLTGLTICYGNLLI
jgi:fatty-acyl-CoA synthase